MSETKEETFALLYKVASNKCIWLDPKKWCGVLDVDTLTTLGVNMVQIPFIVCDYYRKPQYNEICGNVSEVVNYVNNPNR